jgi:ectoine hydroxylase-related dioxygenase (phytanoyl-CoA dioxygenase family)
MVDAAQVDLHNLEVLGFAIIPHVLDEETVVSLLAAIANSQPDASSNRNNSIYAIRNLMQAVPSVRKISEDKRVTTFVSSLMGKSCFAVRAIYFDKNPDANWYVPWHQDLSIAVRERKHVEGYGPWSLKAGVPHVQPPMEVLERMVTVRLHLDDCGEENGPLKVLPGSHKQGRLSPEQIQEARKQTQEVNCIAPRGGAVLMKPLILHASSEAITPGHRRVLHLEYASQALPGGLEWFEQHNSCIKK